MARFSKLGYVALDVTDIARSRAYYEKLVGLQASGTGPAGEVFLRCGNDHHNIVLHQSKRAGLRLIGWEMESEQELDAVVDLLTGAGLTVTEVGAEERAVLQQGRSFRCQEPLTGAILEFYAAMLDLSGLPFAPTVANIQRLGHVVLTTPDYDKAVEFFTRVLGFRPSDIVDGYVTLMRCFPNPFHHSLGLGKGDKRALHHVNFMVTEIDDIGRGLWRFKNNNVDVVYGPGRHPASGSVFLYFLDPDGMTLEYSYGMEEFPEWGARRPRLLAPIQQSSDSWGGPPNRITKVEIL